ncbi:MAG: SUMF1/EgtB/PvdO family nonheme iron enzyme [Sedimenticola sp.]|nr:SUMF1/EgtB/PvdO family nonheme iron enzyme [Sedimenticola sp.]
MKSSFLVCVIALVVTIQVAAAIPAKSVYNPKPDENDLVLPMPGGAELVLRPVEVPGEGFWGSRERVVQLGDATGGAFEGVQRTMVAGSFQEGGSKRWKIWLAKYELTKGQYVAVMGVDALISASGDPKDKKYPTLKGRALDQANAMPLSWISYQAVEDFLRAYNRWLFDPEYPERHKVLPKIDGVPGFIRLATEDEWEYAARGGMEALNDGTFNDRLPFASRQLNEYSWHLKNAKNRLRPVGMRKPNPLGLHDLHGNVHEMTAGIFRPEIWQGKPGGVPIRGASVSSSTTDIRSSFRTEFDAYAWNEEKKRMILRRTFNIGTRLALGSNVVVNSIARTALEKEYAEYRKALRAETPVGRSLDNLVSQATSQLATVDSVLQQLLDRHPDARPQVEAIQNYVEKARGQLDDAQRESARSLLQDASRNGTNYSVLVSKRAKLQTAMVTARKLLEMSTRYQAQVDAVEKSLQDNSTAANEQFKAYLEKVALIGDYEEEFREHAFRMMREKTLSTREDKVLELLHKHIREYNETRSLENEVWSREFNTIFNTFIE